MEKKEIEKVVDQYFGECRHEYEVNMIGKIAYVKVCYYDFKTERTVRNELEALIPNSKVEIGERLYSDRARIAIMMQMLEEGVYVLLDEGNGVFRKVPFYVVLEERLFTKSI